MRKDIAIGTVVVLVIIFGIIFYAAMRPAPAKAPTDGVASSGSILPAGGYSEHAPYYDIVANYPTTTPLTGATNEAAIKLLQDFIAQTIAQFKSDGNFANITPDDVHALGFDQGRKYALQVAYLIGSSARTVSYIFTVYEDTGGAHGNTFFHTFVFDTATGQHLLLTDLFTPGAPYLDTLSRISRTKLPDVIGRDMADSSTIRNGTAPDEKNFVNFFFDNHDFVILFPPYQVAAYAAGPQTLRIPLSELSGILKLGYH